MIKKSEKYKINGVAMPAPSSVTVTMEDLEVSAERDANGYLHRVRARQGLRKVSFGYQLLTQVELAALMKMLESEYFNLTYTDPADGLKTIECYCSKKDGDLYSAVLFNGAWRNVKFNCVER